VTRKGGYNHISNISCVWGENGMKSAGCRGYNPGYGNNQGYTPLAEEGETEGKLPGPCDRIVYCRCCLRRLLRAGWDMPSIREAMVWLLSERRIASATS